VFTQQTQQQRWPGGDLWDGMLNLPKMTRAQAAQWIAFLMALRGTSNCFLVGDPYMATPQGTPTGTPVVDSSVTTNNLAMSTSLVTRGWAANSIGNLLPGDYLQIGNRLHSVLKSVDADSGGAATIQLGPSLREQPADGTAIITNGAKGLFRLASNKRTWSVDETRLFGISIKITEAK
jgi:hypothetical protein